MEYTSKTTCPNRCKYIYTFIYILLCIIITVYQYVSSIAATKFSQQNSILWDGPKYSCYLSYHARMQFCSCWLTASKQKPENLDSASFFHTDKLLYN
jgi:hypothetical protein